MWQRGAHTDRRDGQRVEGLAIRIGERKCRSCWDDQGISWPYIDALTVQCGARYARQRHEDFFMIERVFQRWGAGSQFEAPHAAFTGSATRSSKTCDGKMR